MTTTLADSGLGGKKFKRLNLLLYGPFGTWKTVNAHHLPRTRTLDFDDGMQSVEWAILAGKLDRKLEEIVYSTIIPPATLDENKNNVFDIAADQVEEWVEEEDVPPAEWANYCIEKHGRAFPQLWDTLIIDSGTSLTSSTIIKALKETDRLGLSQSWSKRKAKGLTPRMIQDYGAAGILFEKFMTLCYGTGKNIVLICHEYQHTDKKGNLLGIEPMLVGQLRQSVPKSFDEVWYARVKGTAAASKGVFQTQADPMRRCRSRLGCLDASVDSDFASIKATVAEFYGVPEENLWTAAHGIKGAKALIEEEVSDSVFA
jgi:hypothetical protein